MKLLFEIRPDGRLDDEAGQGYENSIGVKSAHDPIHVPHASWEALTPMPDYSSILFSFT